MAGRIICGCHGDAGSWTLVTHPAGSFTSFRERAETARDTCRYTYAIPFVWNGRKRKARRIWNLKAVVSLFPDSSLQIWTRIKKPTPYRRPTWNPQYARHNAKESCPFGLFTKEKAAAFTGPKSWKRQSLAPTSTRVSLLLSFLSVSSLRPCPLCQHNGVPFRPDWIGAPAWNSISPLIRERSE